MHTTSEPSMSIGIINVDKPTGITSMDVVRKIRKASGLRRVGHGGTLDPTATGVIPVAVGTATRLLEYLLNGNKSYIATIELGTRTSTYDSEGVITEYCDPSEITQENLTDMLSNFQGEIMQTPPMYSAVKIKGKRLYELARKGISVQRKSRKVSIHKLSLLAFEPPVLRIKLECGKGFYVRTFADDLGQILGCGAFLKCLRRLSSGPFRIEQSTKLNKVLMAFEEGRSFEILQEPGICIEEAQRLDLTELETQLVRDGRPIPASAVRNPNEESGMGRAYSSAGHLLAIMRHDFVSSEWRPEKVFN